MPVAFDASYLINLLDPTITGVRHVDVRLDHLVRSLDKARTKIIVPTLALSEVLVGAGSAAPQYLDILSRSSRFRIVAFGTRAAVEAAAAHREAILEGDKREGTKAVWPKVKFDRQIVAIAKVEGATTIYSNDDDIIRFAASDELIVIDFDKLPKPSEMQQGELTLRPPPDEGTNSTSPEE